MFLSRLVPNPKTAQRSITDGPRKIAFRALVCLEADYQVAHRRTSDMEAIANTSTGVGLLVRLEYLGSCQHVGDYDRLRGNRCVPVQPATEDEMNDGFCKLTRARAKSLMRVNPWKVKTSVRATFDMYVGRQSSNGDGIPFWAKAKGHAVDSRRAAYF